jgi:hypothetical protein
LGVANFIRIVAAEKLRFSAGKDRVTIQDQKRLSQMVISRRKKVEGRRKKEEGRMLIQPTF